MKILLTGPRGTLSSSLKEKYECVEINKLTDCESYNPIKKVIKSYSSEDIFILHFAAETNVDLCEKDKLHAINTNYVLTKNIVDLIKDTTNVTLIFASSASVFNGKSGKKSKENDVPDPANFYAFTKLLSEQYISDNLKEYYIFRFGWLVGDPKVDNKFIGNIFRQLREGEKVIYGVDDVYGSLTFADDFVNDLGKVFDKSIQCGLYNYCVDSKLSRFGIIKKIMTYYKISGNVKLVPVPLAKFKPVANRPKFELINNERAYTAGLNTHNSLDDSMNKYLENHRHLIDGIL